MEGNKTAAGGLGSEAVTEFLILNISILGMLTDKELRAIEKYMNLMEVAPGEIVFKEGDKGDCVCFAVDGALDVVRESETGESIVISTLTRGRSIGEMPVIDQLPRSHHQETISTI